MRVLIITHPRSGGSAISNWLSNELNCKLYHEPFLNVNINEFNFNLFLDKNCVVKIFLIEMEKVKIDFIKFIKTFDKIIIHKREDVEDVAISLAYANLNNNLPDDWHKTYEINDKWINQNKELIESSKNEINYFMKELNNLYIKDSLVTKYDRVFYEKTDIDKIFIFLEIKNKPKWLDFLDNSRKLRNGDIGIKSIKMKNII